MKATHPDIRNAIRPFLHDDEELLWCGQPYEKVKYKPNILALLATLFITVSSLTWETMAVGAIISNLSEGLVLPIFIFPIAGAGFVCYAIYTLWFELFGSKKQHKRTCYAVTDKRAFMLITQKKRTELREFVFEKMVDVQFEIYAQGSGTITFMSSNDESKRSAPAFVMIDDVRRVYELISSMLRSILIQKNSQNPQKNRISPLTSPILLCYNIPCRMMSGYKCFAIP